LRALTTDRTLADMRSRHVLFSIAIALTFVAAGCNGDTTSPGTDAEGTDATIDGARTDGGAHDAGASDGSMPLDGGGLDATATDGGADAGTDAFDRCATVTCTPLDGCHLAGTCNAASGLCTNPFASDGTLCSFAPGAGTCHAGSCTVSCTDGTRDGSETDTDCGGTCPSCTTGKQCLVDADCQSMGCTTGTLRCAATRCSDAHVDGAETDVDCGGTCSACATGLHCAVNGDCTSTACDATSLQCVASQCSDHRKDGAETDVDCGGGTCSACATGSACTVNADCTTHACDATTLHCVASQCSDHQHDGAETDVDCGGGTCPTCMTGQACASGSDCTSNACDASTLHCVADPCSDHLRDGAETDVDCGGTDSCARCMNGLRCMSDADCMSSACDASSLLCVADPCADHRRDGAESDVDCGGGTCPACALGQVCRSDTDCTTNACDGISLACVTDQCSDHRRDGAETDADCGGGTCMRCLVGQSCALDSDCTSNACDATSLTCVMNQCMDHRIDGVESDIDCGGGTCPVCTVNRICRVNSDCTVACNWSGAPHVCTSNMCNDGQRDGTETDVDCGGGSCMTSCGLGQHCAVNPDCASNACNLVTQVCVSNQCADQRQDGLETGVDCGGGVCPACSQGISCSLDRDCTTNACDVIAHVCVASQCSDHQRDGNETDIDCGGGTCAACTVGRHCLVTFDCQSGHVCTGGTCI
jgi:hypothetical protein